MRRMVACIGIAVVVATLAALAQAKVDPAKERAAIAKVIHGNICWALTKDRALVESTMAHDADLFMFNPTSPATVGWDELVANFKIWMDPRFKATKCDIRELRINLSRSGDVAWWSAILDDLGEWDGKPTGWRDTRWTGVLEKREGTWVIVQMHFSYAAEKVRAEALGAGEEVSALNAGVTSKSAAVCAGGPGERVTCARSAAFRCDPAMWLLLG
jgi:ketosteroid isomerase-like protein